jgi:DNA primase large subunit
MPEAQEGEAKEFVVRALDWYSENKPKENNNQKITGKYANYKQIKLDNLSEKNFPPCVLKILEGIGDGKKRALFVLLNLFRSVGMDKEQLEKRIYEWNEKNKPPLKKGYIQSQLSWSYRKKPIMPQNCKEFYQGIGVCLPDNFCSRIKNPVNYVVRKNFISNKSKKKLTPSRKTKRT